jgi:methylmalonyl-CoA/ethylmalonyl-CoA epimerase
LSLQLHHTGVLVRDIGKRAELYQRRFGYMVQSPVVHDPVQTAFVQFLKLPDDQAYLELISPDGPESKLANALRKGEGLHHLCYSTLDIDAECDRLKSEGLHLVSPPTAATAFEGRRIAWLMGADRVLLELVERGPAGQP